MTAGERARREAVRLQAAELFAAGIAAPEVAELLRVTPKSAYQWRRDWAASGNGDPGLQRARGAALQAPPGPARGTGRDAGAGPGRARLG